jgi:hypothetical protein
MSQHRSALLLQILLLHAFVLVATAANAAPAATKGECLAKPNKSVSPGEHWYYRYDGVNKRRCWYVGAAADRQRKSSTHGAGLNAPDAPAPQKPAKTPVAKPSPPIAAALGAEPGRETTGMSTLSVEIPSTDEPPDPSRSSVVSRWPEAAAELSVPQAATETVALRAQVTARTADPRQPTAGMTQGLPHTRPPSVHADAHAATSASAGFVRPLAALLLVALALLLMVKPISEFIRWLLSRNAGVIRTQAQRPAATEPHESMRDILDRADAARPQEKPRSRLPGWSEQIARAMQDLAEATEAYRNGAPERVRTSSPDKRVPRQFV